jgi:hypothetical protein
MSCAANLSIADIAFSPSNDLFAVNDETHAVLRWSSAYLESPDIGENKPHYDVVAGHASHPGNHRSFTAAPLLNESSCTLALPQATH